jgi:multidrug efflux pump subunit AcrA (membrane-fusion protein)
VLLEVRRFQLKSELDVDKYDPLLKRMLSANRISTMQPQTNLANKAQVQAAGAAIAAAKAQIRVGKAAVETAAINLNFTRIVSPDR